MNQHNTPELPPFLDGRYRSGMLLFRHDFVSAKTPVDQYKIDFMRDMICSVDDQLSGHGYTSIIDTKENAITLTLAATTGKCANNALRLHAKASRVSNYSYYESSLDVLLKSHPWPLKPVLIENKDTERREYQLPKSQVNNLYCFLGFPQEFKITPFHKPCERPAEVIEKRTYDLDTELFNSVSRS